MIFFRKKVICARTGKNVSLAVTLQDGKKKDTLSTQWRAARRRRTNVLYGTIAKFLQAWIIYLKMKKTLIS